MKLKTMKARSKREFNKKTEKEKLMEMKAHLEALRTRMNHLKKTMKTLERQRKDDMKEAQELLDIVENHDFENYKKKYYYYKI